jgi:hypothetical protein
MLKSTFDQISWQTIFFLSLENPPLRDHKNQIEQKSSDSQSVDFSEEKNSFPLQQLHATSFQKSLSVRFILKVSEVAAKIFQDKIEELDGLKNECLACTGSDGREEKLSFYSSLIEMMLIVPKQDALKTGIIDKIQKILLEHPTFFYCKLEIKCLEEDSLICFNLNWDLFKPKNDRPFPTRAIDARYVIGNESILTSYKKKFFREVQDLENAKLLKKFRISTVKPTLKLLESLFEKQNLKDVNLKSGILHYDGKRIKATKYPLIRPVQYRLGQYICKQIQKKKLSEEDFLTMPSTTIERIQWLVNQNLLEMENTEIQAIQKAYIASLIWFGQAQQNFELQNLEETQCSPDDLKAVTEVIVRFCNNQAFFYPEDLVQKRRKVRSSD